MSRARAVPQQSVAVALPRWAEAIAHTLDTAFVIPGTRIPIGLDAVLGLLLPGAADVATALVTASFIWVGFRRGVPKVILLRMLFNIGIDAAVGAIPVVGDVFDVFHRAASTNLQLVRQYATTGIHPGFGDYAFVTGVLLALAALLILPLFVVAGVLYGVLAWMM